MKLTKILLAITLLAAILAIGCTHHHQVSDERKLVAYKEKIDIEKSMVDLDILIAAENYAAAEDLGLRMLSQDPKLKYDQKFMGLFGKAVADYVKKRMEAEELKNEEVTK